MRKFAGTLTAFAADRGCDGYELWTTEYGLFGREKNIKSYGFAKVEDYDAALATIFNRIYEERPARWIGETGYGFLGVDAHREMLVL